MLRFFVFICFVSCILAKWGQWKEVDGYSDTCGMCGTKVVAVRKCQSKICSGSEERIEICGETLCLFPRKTCCDGFIKGLVENRLECIPKVEEKEGKNFD